MVFGLESNKNYDDEAVKFRPWPEIPPKEINIVKISIYIKIDLH